jgi:hypothetical protein
MLSGGAPIAGSGARENEDRLVVLTWNGLSSGCVQRRVGGGGRGGWCGTRRHQVDRLSATLTCAGRNRSVFMRRWCPILCTSVTVGGRWCGERLGDRCLRRRWPTRPAFGRAWLLEPIGKEHAAVMVRRSSRPTRTRRVRGRPRWPRRCGALCAPRDDGTVHRVGSGRRSSRLSGDPSDQRDRPDDGRDLGRRDR